MSTPAKTGRIEIHPETGFQSHHGQAIGFDDFVMDDIDDRWHAIHNGTEWVELSRSSNN